MYTDGACLGNPGPGGWAWAVPQAGFASGAEARATNQQMEVRAALEAVKAITGPVEVVSDSTYVVNCFRDRWWEGWLARNWLNKAKQPVANKDLWEPLIDEVRRDPARVQFRWVKGHSADLMNDLVDRLAVEAARTQQGRTGDGPPTDLGPADSPGGTGGADARRPDGFRLIVTGHKPPELGGYDANAVSDRVKAKLAALLAAERELHPDVVVLTGLGLGAEQLAAEAADAAGVPYVAVLPYPEPDALWPSGSRRRFAELLARSRGQIVLQQKKPESRQLAGAALRRRDAWLARNGDEAVVIWDQDDSLVGRQVRALQDALGEEQVMILEPGPPEGR
ncbi:MAG: ribonuclease H family protein [Acidimicrobiales bacterium]